MGTRVAQNSQSTGSDMPGKFSLKNHVKKLTKECLKAFESSTPAVESGPLEETFVVRDGGGSSEDGGGHPGSVDMIDGGDSGVEVVRALSSNGSNSDRFTPVQSCESSLLSCYSEAEGDRGSDCGSENSKDGKKDGLCLRKVSESSRMANRAERLRFGSRGASDKDLSESCSENSSTCESQANRTTDLTRSVSTRLQNGKKTEYLKTSLMRRGESGNRLTSRERSLGRSHTAARSNLSQQVLSTADKTASKARGSKPLKGSASTEVRSCRVDDGRWPSSVQRGQTGEARSRIPHDPTKIRSMPSSAAPSSMTSSLSGRSALVEVKSNALDKYGTLPRRSKRKSAAEVIGDGIHGAVGRSSSASREPSLNRAATLRRQQSRDKDSNSIGNGKYLPPYPKSRRSSAKTVIYHEISIQTNVTGEDIANAFSGIPQSTPITGNVEKANKAVQSEGREKLKKMEESYAKVWDELEREKRENERLKSERQGMLMRICKLLGHGEASGNGRSELNELEQHFQAVGLTVIKQQEELSELRHYKSIMQRDLEKSFAAQKTLLQQQQDIEAEYIELQEFLQAEKTALSESLNDTEAEVERLRKEVTKREDLLQQQQEECKHLVRICEQRRQENLSLEAKLSGLEQRSRDVIVQQGAAVSGAAVALSGLGARLDTLVEQLAASCNISEKDLEDVIYHNEMYANGHSDDSSPDTPLPKKAIGEATESPKRGTSFLNAIIGALRNATQSPFSSKKASLPNSQTDQITDFGLLESENDVSLTTEPAFEENASSVSHYTDCGSCSSRSDLMKYELGDDAITLVPNVEYGMGTESPDLSRSDSIQNLSAAILARQEIEKIERTLSPDLIIPTEVNSLVDKVIDVDNLLTKLLKVLRIIQLESDVSMEQLEDQRLELTEKLQQEQMCRQKAEDHLHAVQHELKEARSQLSARIVQLEQAKMIMSSDARSVIVDSQRQFAAIHNAIGTLQSIQDVVNKCPPLAKLQQDLEDYNYLAAAGDDLNANTATNGNVNIAEVKRGGTVLTTAV